MKTDVVFFKVCPDDIYVKVARGTNDKVHSTLLDIFLDTNRKVTPVTGEEWEDNIDYGKSYEILTKEEVEEFRRNHIKLIE